MIDASRFLVRSSDPRWHELRRQGVSATTVAHAATESGFRQVLEERAHPQPVADNDYMAFGRWAEPIIMETAHREYGILPSDWTIRAADNPAHVATPDGLNLEHTLIAECKTGGTVPKSIPRVHRDQMFWQMYCTDTERGLYLFNQRAVDDAGDYYLGLFEPLTFWLDRDDDRIRELKSVADKLLEAESGELQRTA